MVGGLHNYSGGNVPSHVSTGRSGQTWHIVLAMAVTGERVTIGNIVTIQQRKKVPESQTSQAEIRLINILCFLRLLKLAFGECSEVFRAPEAKTHVGNGQTYEAQAQF